MEVPGEAEATAADPHQEEAIVVEPQEEVAVALEVVEEEEEDRGLHQNSECVVIPLADQKCSSLVHLRMHRFFFQIKSYSFRY